MKYRCAKTFEFCAAHSNPRLPLGHKCRSIHGHNYRLTMIFESEKLDRYGFVLDLSKLNTVKDYINSTLDHRTLQDFMCTMELMAAHFYKKFKHELPELVKVIVEENPRLWAAYYE